MTITLFDAGLALIALALLAIAFSVTHVIFKRAQHQGFDEGFTAGHESGFDEGFQAGAQQEGDIAFGAGVNAALEELQRLRIEGDEDIRVHLQLIREILS